MTAWLINKIIIVSALMSATVGTANCFGAEIAGVVLDDGDPQLPVEKVIISVFATREGAEAHSGSSKAAATDADGNFRVENVSPGIYFVLVNPTGFGVNRMDKESPFRDFVLPREPIEVIVKEGAPARVGFTLRHGATITGRAITAKGDPIHPAIVGVSNGSNTGRIDKEGKFVVRGIPTGEEQRLLITPTKPPEYIYSRYVDVDGAKLTAGATVDVGEIRFDPMPAQSNLLGTMTDGAGDLLEGLRIYQLHHTTLPITRGLIVKEGKIDQKMLPGEYRVTGRVDERLIATIVVPAEGLAEVRLSDPQAKPNPNNDPNAR